MNIYEITIEVSKNGKKYEYSYGLYTKLERAVGEFSELKIRDELIKEIGQFPLKDEISVESTRWKHGYFQRWLLWRDEAGNSQTRTIKLREREVEE